MTRTVRWSGFVGLLGFLGAGQADTFTCFYLYHCHRKLELLLKIIKIEEGFDAQELIAEPPVE